MNSPLAPCCGILAQGARECSWLYLGVNAEYVALHLIHGVQAVRHRSQVEPLENHLVLGESPWENSTMDWEQQPPAQHTSCPCCASSTGT